VFEFAVITFAGPVCINPDLDTTGPENVDVAIVLFS
jgi:hypothetical protein